MNCIHLDRPSAINSKCKAPTLPTLSQPGSRLQPATVQLVQRHFDNENLRRTDRRPGIAATKTRWIRCHERLPSMTTHDAPSVISKPVPFQTGSRS
ncbi:hypothetical protein ARMGADRAFT_429014 [Armillaria gallica]|uniref:Uncharacterized protein n=1 Tax=Armillaria gallica TaxID=47427 RepID=A0A2H3DLG8_ARMGA|nr:hypothetical protein ARMGADRAFT_429014 [Armillaria gallica]